MKKLFERKKTFMIPLLVLFFLASCTEEENDNINPSSTSVTALSSLLMHPNGFRISEFIEEGINETSEYEPYTFIFNENQVVNAFYGNDTINGTFLVFTDDNKTELRMDFPGNSALYELTDDWYFVSHNNGAIRFNDSGDIIQFQKQ